MPERILVRGVNWVGDAVMTMPAIRAIRRARPDARIDLLVKPWVAPLFEADPSVDEILLYDRSCRGTGGRMALARMLRARGYSSAILFQNAFDAALIAWLARIPRRIGYARDLRGLLLTDPVPYRGEDRRMHHVEYYLELLRRAGIDAERSEPWIYLRPEERFGARARLSALKRPVVGLNPGAAYGSAKQWPTARFAELAGEAVAGLNGSVVLFGGPGEAAIADAIVSAYKGPPERMLNLALKTSLRELAALISECDLLVSNDSGPMHVGYAVKTPLVAVFGSTEPALTGPPHEGAVALRTPVECGPCFERVCPTGTMRCMDAITTQEVMDALRKLLPSRRAVFLCREAAPRADAHLPAKGEDFDLIEGIESTGPLEALKDRGFVLIGVRSRLESGAPSPYALLKARSALGIDLRRSFVIGGSDSDMLLARSIGATGVLVRAGEQPKAEHADYTAPTLKEAAGLIKGLD